jgi:hypothetical protein
VSERKKGRAGTQVSHRRNWGLEGDHTEVSTVLRCPLPQTSDPSHVACGLQKTRDPPEVQKVEQGLGQNFFICSGRIPGVLQMCRKVEIRLV